MLVPFIKRSSLYKKAISNVRDRLCGPVKDLEHVLFQYAKGVQAARDLNFESLKKSVLSFLEERRIGTEPWEYGFSASSPYSSLYTATYVVMLRSMYLGPGAGYSVAELNKLKEYFLHFQDPETGYFIDPSLEDGEYISPVNGNNQWWGYGHLLGHVLPCLDIVGIAPRYEFTFLKELRSAKGVRHFFSSLDFGARIEFSGNIVMNIGIPLQYEYSRNGNVQSKAALDTLLILLREKANNIGMWGEEDDSPTNKSRKVQAAYHWWVFFFYAHQLPPGNADLIDYLISTQNRLGGYGAMELCSSACEDIDTIDPLSRFFPHVDEINKKKIWHSFQKALPWVLANQNDDGGFVFAFNGKLQYGHAHLFADINESSMFPTWFRSLSIAHLMKVLNIKNDFYLCNCPGFLF